MKNIINIALLAVMILFIAGCTAEYNPLGTEKNPDNPLRPKVAASVILEPVPVVLEDLPAPVNGRQMPVSASAYITPAKGGKIEMSYYYQSVLGTTVKRWAKFTVPPGAVLQNVFITMSFDTSVAGVRFAPEGLVFRTPARLDLETSGLDLTNLLYNLYWDEENGKLTRMQTKAMPVDLLKGSIRCVDGKIPHFSRYAFGR